MVSSRNSEVNGISDTHVLPVIGRRDKLCLIAKPARIYVRLSLAEIIIESANFVGLAFAIRCLHTTSHNGNIDKINLIEHIVRHS